MSGIMQTENPNTTLGKYTEPVPTYPIITGRTVQATRSWFTGKFIGQPLVTDATIHPH